MEIKIVFSAWIFILYLIIYIIGYLTGKRSSEITRRWKITYTNKSSIKG